MDKIIIKVGICGLVVAGGIWAINTISNKLMDKVADKVVEKLAMQAEANDDNDILEADEII